MTSAISSASNKSPELESENGFIQAQICCSVRLAKTVDDPTTTISLCSTSVSSSLVYSILSEYLPTLTYMLNIRLE